MSCDIVPHPLSHHTCALCGEPLGPPPFMRLHGDEAFPLHLACLAHDPADDDLTPQGHGDARRERRVVESATTEGREAG